MKRRSWFIFPALPLAACATPPAPPLLPQQGPFGPEQSFTGTLVLGFERQSLDQCWLDLAGSAQADLRRLAPSPALADSQAAYAAEVTLTGRRRDMLDVEGRDVRGASFGHLGMYPCLVEATRITAAHLR
jgi:hypothetical protein